MADLTTSLLSLPPELRLRIYDFIIPVHLHRIYDEDEGDEHIGYDFSPIGTLLTINKQIYQETIHLVRRNYTFVKIELPWPQARLRIETEGNVPIIIGPDDALRFDNYHLKVIVDAPNYAHMTNPEQFVILLDDLHRFSRMWMYANLTFSTLNNELRLTMSLNAPFTPSYEEQRVSKQLQKIMILPFGEVKGLVDTVFTGNIKPYSSVVKELRDLQEQPYKSPEACLRDAVKLKDKGNAALKAERWTEALEIYRQSWEAMHIIIRGRHRFEHADAWFGMQLKEEPYKDKNGQAERLYIRIELVAKTCQLYYAMEDFEKSAFWGMRSIQKLREAMSLPEENLAYLNPQDEAVSEQNFPGVSAFADIYKWTGLARYKLGQKRDAVRLLEVAKVYYDRQNLDEDESITSILNRYGV